MADPYNVIGIEWKRENRGNRQEVWAAQYGQLGLRVASMEEHGLGWGMSVSGANWEIGINLQTKEQAQAAAVIAAGSALTFIAGVVAQLRPAEPGDQPQKQPSPPGQN